MKLTAATRLAAATVAVLTLAGCVKVQADTSIGADETFSQHFVIAFNDSVASQISQQAGLNVDELTDGLVDSPEFADLQAKYPDQVTVEDYAEDDLNGVELTLTDLPLEEFNGAASDLTAGVGGTASIEHVDGTFVVTMSSPDLDAAADGGADVPGADALAGLDLDSLGLNSANVSALSSAIDFRLSYTFPGLVTEASAGEINGNTVNLGLQDVVAGETVRIVGGDSPQIDWWPFIKWGLIIGAFVVVVGGAALLVRQDKRRQRTNTLPPPTVG